MQLRKKPARLTQARPTKQSRPAGKRGRPPGKRKPYEKHLVFYKPLGAFVTVHGRPGVPSEIHWKGKEALGAIKAIKNTVKAVGLGKGTYFIAAALDVSEQAVANAVNKLLKEDPEFKDPAFIKKINKKFDAGAFTAGLGRNLSKVEQKKFIELMKQGKTIKEISEIMLREKERFNQLKALYRKQQKI